MNISENFGDTEGVGVWVGWNQMIIVSFTGLIQVYDLFNFDHKIPYLSLVSA